MHIKAQQDTAAVPLLCTILLLHVGGSVHVPSETDLYYMVHFCIPANDKR